MQKTEILHKSVSNHALQIAYVHNFDKNLMFEEPLPRRLLGDQHRLKQILINLVKNSLKFALGGVIRIYMSFD